MSLDPYLKLFASLFSITDPIGVVPIFLALTAGRSLRESRRIALTAALAMTLVLAIALLGGQQVLALFGISLASFRVAGGLLLLLLSLSMLRAEATPLRETREEHVESETRASIAVVPLAIPLLAGPGAISTVIVYAHQDHGPNHLALTGATILAVTTVCGVCLGLAPTIGKVLGRTGVNIVTRVMGLILAALSIELITGGLRELFPGLAG